MRLLKYIIILLFVVIIAEALYLFVIKGFLADQKEQSNVAISISKAPTPAPATQADIEIDENRLDNIDRFYYDINPNMAIDPKVIYSHIFYKKGVTQKSVIQNTHQGKIAEIDRTKKPAFYGYYDTVLTIRIVSDNDPSIGITLNFSEEDLKKTSVFVDIDDQVQPASPDILKVGDMIIVEDTIDATLSIPNENAEKDGFLTKSWGSNRIRTQITKIN